MNQRQKVACRLCCAVNWSFSLFNMQEKMNVFSCFFSHFTYCKSCILIPPNENRATHPISGMNDPVRSFRRSFYRREHCLLVYLHLLICLPDQHGHIHAGPPTLDVIHSIVKAFSRDVVAAVHPEPVLNITIAFAVCSAADILVRVSGGVYTAQGLDNNRIHLRFQQFSTRTAGRNRPPYFPPER